jgi:hypothetical protein
MKSDCKFCGETYTASTIKKLERAYVEHIKISPTHAVALEILRIRKRLKLEALGKV